MPETTPGYAIALAAAEELGRQQAQHHAETEAQAAQQYAQTLATPPTAEALAYMRERLARPRTWRLELPAEINLLNANDRMHPAKRSPYVKVIRQAAWAMARHHKLPALQRAHIYYVIHPDTKGRRRDPGNWSPSAKAAVDGLVDAGVLPDDNRDHLLGPDPRIGDPVRGSQLVLWITDLDSLTPHHLALLNPPNTLPGDAR